jgi:hypothetical protein
VLGPEEFGVSLTWGMAGRLKLGVRLSAGRTTGEPLGESVAEPK